MKNHSGVITKGTRAQKKIKRSQKNWQKPNAFILDFTFFFEQFHKIFWKLPRPVARPPRTTRKRSDSKLFSQELIKFKPRPLAHVDSRFHFSADTANSTSNRRAKYRQQCRNPGPTSRHSLLMHLMNMGPFLPS